LDFDVNNDNLLLDHELSEFISDGFENLEIEQELLAQVEDELNKSRSGDGTNIDNLGGELDELESMLAEVTAAAAGNEDHQDGSESSSDDLP